jgi:tetratricopeptide (TPR) repeat protein
MREKRRPRADRPSEAAPGPRPGRPARAPAEAEAPYPEGWQKEFFGKADLERSLAALEGYDHFFSHAMRGYIRSLQLDFEGGWEWFDRAYEGALEAEETIPNLVRQFLLNIHCFEHALVEAPLDADGGSLPHLAVPELPEAILRDFPEVRLVINLRRQSEGVLRVHLGDFEASLEVFEDLIEESPRERPDNLMWYYLGAAASQHGLGLVDEARRSLENAAFAAQTGGEVINRGRVAAVLYAWYRYLGEFDEARGWREFLERLDTPRATKDLFLRRAKIILERSTEQSSLLVL